MMNQNGDNFIPERFSREVIVHITKNLLSTQLPQTPLILGIHGPSGFGKTYQCEQVLKNINAKVFLISGGQFESKDAGEPARMLRQRYRDASSSIMDKEAQIAVLLINDIDTGLGNWGENVQTTINTQTVFGELMHITDYPNIVDDRETRRIPIIITGNDFTKLYAPFVRAGRMTSFEWIPTLTEKQKIVNQIFGELDEAECKKLVYNLDDIAQKRNISDSLSVAFYSHLRTILYDEYIWAILKQYGVNETIEGILSGRQPKLKTLVDYDLVLHRAVELIGSGKLVNHLRE